jgi:hypothetical protein
MDRVEEQRGPGERPGDRPAERPADGPSPVEELEHGPDREPSPTASWLHARWLRLTPATRSTALALAGVVAGAALVIGVQGLHGTPRPTAAPTGRATLPVSATLVSQDICTSFQGQVLQVSFRVVNAGQRPVDVVGVRADLPLGGLLTIDATQENGSCGTGPPGPVDGRLQPGQSLPVTFRLLPLESCPQPAPVSAVVDLANQSPATVSVPVLVDLGSVDFPGCATTVATP